MKSSKRSIFAVAVSLMSPVCHSQGCSKYNSAFTEVPYYDASSYHHQSGSHVFTAQGAGSCSYTNTANLAPGAGCAVTCSAKTALPLGQTGDLGALNSLLIRHEVNNVQAGGVSWASGSLTTGGAASCGSISAAAARECSVMFSCAVTLSVNATANGVGATVNFPADQIWAPTHNFMVSCAPFNVPAPA